MQKKVFRWFWVWDDENEESWLSGMASRGWHLKSIGFPGVYQFEPGVPAAVAYRLDYSASKDKDQYLRTFLDAGWDFAGQRSGWYYFRKHQQGDQAPEIFSDNSSKIEKYRRVLRSLFVVFPAVILVALYRPDSTRLPGFVWYDAALVLLIILEAILLYAMARLFSRIQQLKGIRQ
jgi:hypothetical protein